MILKLLSNIIYRLVNIERPKLCHLNPTLACRPNTIERYHGPLLELDLFKKLQDKVNEIAAALGLVKVGWIFTDLVNDAGGKVKHFRKIDTHFLTAQVATFLFFFYSGKLHILFSQINESIETDVFLLLHPKTPLTVTNGSPIS